MYHLGIEKQTDSGHWLVPIARDSDAAIVAYGTSIDRSEAIRRAEAIIIGFGVIGNDATPQDMVAPHPAVAAVLQFFDFAHLPEHLQAISRPFHTLAWKVANGRQNAEATVALRKLLEAKDAAVRAHIAK